MSEGSIKISSNTQRKKNLTEALARLENDVENLNNQKNQIGLGYEKFQDEVIGNGDGIKKDGKLSILGDVKDSQKKINDYYNHLFENEDDKKSLEDKINSFSSEIEEAKKDAVSTQEEINESKIKTDEVVAEINSTKDVAISTLKEIEKIKTKFDSFCQSMDERDNQIKSQREELNSELKKLTQLNSQSSELLAEITDKSLHNAFKKEARANKDGQLFYFWFSILILIGGSFLFLHSLKIEIGNNSKVTSQELWLLRFFLSVPFAFAYWLCSSKAAIKMKLAEEYQHKASIAEALSGYREMWSLKHTDAEYQKLFNLVSSDLIKNPADKIKISHKDIFEKVEDTAKSILKGINPISQETDK